MSLKNLRAEIQSSLGVNQSPEEDYVEIRSGVFILYNNSQTMFTLDNFLAQSIGMWLWKYALCPMFEERVRSDDLRKTIILCYRNKVINTRLLGQIINSMRMNSVRIQYSDFGRTYGWQWNGKEDLATSMWLFTSTWIYDTDVIEWNNATAVAPGDGSRQAIEEELMELDFMGVVDGYFYQRNSAYLNWKETRAKANYR